jgi:beta-galactosidase
MRSLLIGYLTLFTGFAAAADRNLADLFSPARIRCTHCDFAAVRPGSVRVTVWRGYQTAGFDAAQPPVSDVSAWKSLRFEVDNPYREPFSVFVRVSDHAGHPPAQTYTGGTFDGFVIGPGRSVVEISLENMQSPEGHPIDPRHVAWMGVFFQPLFLRDGMDLQFTGNRTFVLSSPQLSAAPAKVQKQPYGDLLFAETGPGERTLRRQTEQALADLGRLIAEAKRRGADTSYAEIYPFVADVAFRLRLVAFWQDRAEEQRKALNFLLEGSRNAGRELRETLAGRGVARTVPPLPDYSRLMPRDGYFRMGANPVLLFGMLYNADGPLRRWFANSQTDYGSELVAGATRHDVERQPIWKAYQKYPDTHRAGWDHADHIIRDASSWEVVGPPVSICLESPHTRAAVAEMIGQFEKRHAGDRTHLVQNMGFEYTYVCYCDYTRRMWQDWLRRKYGETAKANSIWKTRFGSFADVPMPRPEGAAANRALWFDWASFNLYRFVEQIRWTAGEIRRWEPAKPLTIGSPYFAFDPAFWTGVDEEELADSNITGVVLEENYRLDTLMPEYMHALARTKPVADFEYHGVIHQILPSFLHGDAAMSMWWWNETKKWTPNEPINEWTTNLPQSYTIALSDVAKSMRDALDMRRLGREIAALGSAPRPVALLYSKTSMLQQLPGESAEIDTFPYLSTLRAVYNASQSAGMYVGLTTEKKIQSGDLERRKLLVVAGAEFVPQTTVEAILRWVQGGGTLVVAPDALLADEYARPADTLGKLGLRLVRRDPAPLQHGEKVVTEYNAAELPRMEFTLPDGSRLAAAGGRQVLECAASQVLGRFADGTPALIRLRRGRGMIYWLAAPLEPASWRRLLGLAGATAGLQPELQVLREDAARENAGPMEDVEYRLTTLDGRRLAYVYNGSDRDLQLSLKARFPFQSLIDRRTEKALKDTRFVLPARETAILEFR